MSVEKQNCQEGYLIYENNFFSKEINLLKSKEKLLKGKITPGTAAAKEVEEKKQNTTENASKSVE